MYYFLDSQNNQKGPFDANVLLSWGITPETMVWREGMPAWAKASTVPELQSLFNARQGTPPPTSDSGTQGEETIYGQPGGGSNGGGVGSGQPPFGGDYNSHEWYDNPLKTMPFDEAVKCCFHKYAVFTGRASRAEYWWLYLASILLLFIPILGLIINLGLIIPIISAGVRRMHDTNHSGWYLVIPIYNIILLATEGDKFANEYGPIPANRFR